MCNKEGDRDLLKVVAKKIHDGHRYPKNDPRLFTIRLGGESPIDIHYYRKTMYFLHGKFEYSAPHSESGEMVEKKKCGLAVTIDDMVMTKLNHRIAPEMGIGKSCLSEACGVSL